MHLGGANCHADDLNGPRNQMDVSRGQVDTLDVLNIAVIGGISHGDEPDTYLSPGDAKHDVDKTDGLGSHADVLGVH